MRTGAGVWVERAEEAMADSAWGAVGRERVEIVELMRKEGWLNSCFDAILQRAIELELPFCPTPPPRSCYRSGFPSDDSEAEEGVDGFRFRSRHPPRSLSRASPRRSSASSRDSLHRRRRDEEENEWGGPPSVYRQRKFSSPRVSSYGHNNEGVEEWEERGGERDSDSRSYAEEARPFPLQSPEHDCDASKEEWVGLVEEGGDGEKERERGIHQWEKNEDEEEPGPDPDKPLDDRDERPDALLINRRELIENNLPEKPLSSLEAEEEEEEEEELEHKQPLPEGEEELEVVPIDKAEMRMHSLFSPHASLLCPPRSCLSNTLSSSPTVDRNISPSPSPPRQAHPSPSCFIADSHPEPKRSPLLPTPPSDKLAVPLSLLQENPKKTHNDAPQPTILPPPVQWQKQKKNPEKENTRSGDCEEDKHDLRRRHTCPESHPHVPYEHAGSLSVNPLGAAWTAALSGSLAENQGGERGSVPRPPAHTSLSGSFSSFPVFPAPTVPRGGGGGDKQRECQDTKASPHETKEGGSIFPDTSGEAAVRPFPGPGLGGPVEGAERWGGVSHGFFMMRQQRQNPSWGGQGYPTQPMQQPPPPPPGPPPPLQSDTNPTRPPQRQPHLPLPFPLVHINSRFPAPPQPQPKKILRRPQGKSDRTELQNTKDVCPSRGFPFGHGDKIPTGRDEDVLGRMRSSLDSGLSSDSFDLRVSTETGRVEGGGEGNQEDFRGEREEPASPFDLRRETAFLLSASQKKAENKEGGGLSRSISEEWEDRKGGEGGGKERWGSDGERKKFKSGQTILGGGSQSPHENGGGSLFPSPSSLPPASNGRGVGDDSASRPSLLDDRAKPFRKEAERVGEVRDEMNDNVCEGSAMHAIGGTARK
uniref:Uncharacterized protein n=1 Tax=Chromera velia CCMP2878 TaxID=1169474 RepID=A0A0G4HSA0_9ALVE|eukprot:Cvel_8250.t1-p1 / transcript=Cvel_8250.t1 / gene=Cvel_8250 / organism=Chromera_velia_CCMP2878 / gene_product=hypothetical protein / transcript_product=hypothetical protein / location=Cvel_scaffold451:59256-62028(+) / protein_length=872 / sequence_SO=supercontig / SO=protein_coding / is_pseudo=false